MVSKFFEDRYPEGTLELLKGLDGLNPKSEYYMDWKTLESLVNKYADILDISKSELHMETLKYRCTSSTGFHPPSFPAITKLVRFRDSIAATSAECERGFSTMNRIKTPMRSSLADERTSDLVLLGHNKDLTKSLDLMAVLDEFAEQARRIPLK